MTVSASRISAFRRQLANNLEKRPEARVLAFRIGDEYTGPDRIDVNGRSVRVVWCPSELAIREQLASHDSNGDETLVILTPQSEGDLSADVRARLPKGRLITVDPWTAVLEMFGAHAFDSRLARRDWLAQELLESAPADGFKRVPTGFLDRQTAWRTFFEHRLGLEEGRTDLQQLLQWTLEADRLRPLQEAPAEQQQNIVDRIRETSGEAAGAVARLACGKRGPDTVPIGLACGVLFDEGAAEVAVLEKGAVRLEPLLDGNSLSEDAGRAWASAAERILSRLSEEKARQVRKAGDAVLEELKILPEAHRSSVLPAGYRARLERFASALDSALTDPVEISPDLVAAARAVADHEFPTGPRAGGVEMATRLVRWLEQVGAPTAAASEGFEETAHRFARDGAFVDWARTAVGRSDGGGALSGPYERLLTAVAERRETQNQEFAERLGSWLAAPAREEPTLVPVEKILDRITVPLARRGPVLLLVLDGIGLPVLQELADGLRRRGWMERVPADVGQRLLAVATLPTVTEISRASLLAGRLEPGDQAREKRRFEAHEGLGAVTVDHRPPVVFHQAELRSDHGTSLGERVRETILDRSRKVVGAVVNAIDDHLLKGEQIVPEWSVETIRPLPGLLEAAHEAERTVILVADHGHVLDRGTEAREGNGGERWRQPPPPAAEGEIELQGSRVVAEGQRIVAPWSERIRYGSARRSGYHGGATPQEVLAPLMVLSCTEELPEGWTAISRAFPDWWEEEPVAVPSRPSEPRARSAPSEPEDSSEPQISLFDESDEAAEPVESVEWIEQLLESSILERQREQAGPLRLDDAQLRQVLQLFEVRGGRMTREAMGRALNLPPFRVRGVVAALQRILNVEGYPVVSGDGEEDTVALNKELLATQFEIES